MDELYAQLAIAPAKPSRQPVHFGGPVAPGQGFVLHSTDYREAETLIVGEEFALTATQDILRATAEGRGPRQSLVALGYAGWGPGQLDAEIGANGWLLVAADPSLAFGADDRQQMAARARQTWRQSGNALRRQRARLSALPRWRPPRS